MTMTTTNLVKRIQAGDKSAFSELYSIHHDDFCRYAKTICRNEHDAEEVVQDTFMRIMNKFHQLRDPSKFHSWFFSSMRHEIINKHRRPRPDLAYYWELDGVVDGNEGAEAVACNKEFREQVSSILPPIYESVVVEFYWNSRSVREIAKKLRIPEGTVKRRLSVGRKKLAEVVE